MAYVFFNGYLGLIGSFTFLNCIWQGDCCFVYKKTLLDLFWATRRDQIMLNLQDYKEKLDCGRYVAVITYVSLREMIKPGAFTIISPMIIRWLIACHLNLLLLLISLRVKWSFLDIFIIWRPSVLDFGVIYKTLCTRG